MPQFGWKTPLSAPPYFRTHFGQFAHFWFDLAGMFRHRSRQGRMFPTSLVGEWPARHRPMADNDARADRPPHRVPSRSRDTLHRPASAHRHKQKQGHPAIPALSDSSLHQDSKNRIAPELFAADSSVPPPGIPFAFSVAPAPVGFPETVLRSFCLLLPAPAPAPALCGRIARRLEARSPSMGRLPPQSSSHHPRVVSNPPLPTAPAPAQEA